MCIEPVSTLPMEQVRCLSSRNIGGGRRILFLARIERYIFMNLNRMGEGVQSHVSKTSPGRLLRSGSGDVMLRINCQM